MKRLIAIILGLVFIVAAGVALYKRSRPAPLPPPPPSQVPVQTVPVVKRDFQQKVFCSGKVVPVDASELSCKASGIIELVTVREGDLVHKGQLLVRLRQDDLRAQVAQAEAGVLAAKARLEQAKAGNTITGTTVETNVAQAEAALASAKTRLAQAMSAYQLQQATTTSTIAQAEAALQAAKQRHALETGSRSQEKEQAHQATLAAKSAYDTASKNLARMSKLLEGGAIAQAQYDAAKLQYDTAKSQYEAALARESLVQEGPRQEEIRAARADVERLTAAVAQAKASTTRNVITQKDIDNAKAAVKRAEAALEAAKAGRNQRTVSAEEVHAAEAGLAQAKAALAQARAYLREATIYAPFDGVVVQKLAEKGQMAAPGVPLLRIARFSPIFAALEVPEEEAGAVDIGQEAEVRVASLPQKVFKGRIKEIVPEATRGNRSIIAKVELANPQHKLYPGAYVNGAILVRLLPDSLVIPTAAITGETGKPIVYVVENGKASRRAIEIAYTSGDETCITSGVKAGELVVVEGYERLSDGSPVKIVEPEAEAK